MSRDKKRNYGHTLAPEERIRHRIARFAIESIEKVNTFSPHQLVEGNSINPLLIWALGINDFDQLAKYLVIKKLDRSFVTGFGSVIEDMVKIAAGGKRGKWWDVVKGSSEAKLYLCVKSGPADMDKDQVEHFALQSKKVMKTEPNALPMIAMGYGKEVWPVIISTLKSQGLDPNKHTIMGKKLFDKVTGDPNFHAKIPKIVGEAAASALTGTRIIDLIDLKIREVTEYFSKNFRDVDTLLQYVFDPKK